MEERKKTRVEDEEEELADGATRDTTEVNTNISDVEDDTFDLEKEEETEELDRSHTYFRSGENSRHAEEGEDDVNKDDAAYTETQQQHQRLQQRTSQQGWRRQEQRPGG